MTIADDPDDFRMSFGDHLEELRRRLILAMVGVAVACVGTFYFGWDIVAWLCEPLAHAQRRANLPAQVYGLGVGTAFNIYMKVAIVSAIVVASPWVVYQLWKFISAGLYAAERRIVILIAPFSTFMTVLAVLFTYYIMLPAALMFLVGFTNTFPAVSGTGNTLWDRVGHIFSTPADPAAASPDIALQTTSHIEVLTTDPFEPTDGQLWFNVPEGKLKIFTQGQTLESAFTTPTLMTLIPDINNYIGFATLMGLAIVISFQLPVVMLISGWTGLINPTIIANQRKYVVFGCFVASAMLTPSTDALTMLILAVPLIGLFELGLVLMRMTYRKLETPPEQTP